MAEIERFAGDPRFVQVMARGDTQSEWGDRKYWPIYAAAEAPGFVAMCHAGGPPGNKYTGSGAPSYYLEQHVWLHMPVARLAMSMICEGVFDEYPGLRVALVEACLTWAGPLQWLVIHGIWAYGAAPTDPMARTRLPGALLPARRGRAPARIGIEERTVAAPTPSDPAVAVITPEDEREARGPRLVWGTTAAEVC